MDPNNNPKYEFVQQNLKAWLPFGLFETVCHLVFFECCRKWHILKSVLEKSEQNLQYFLKF